MFKWPKWNKRGKDAANADCGKQATTSDSPVAVTMIHPAEFAVTRENIEQRYRGWGEIVDLGSWMGGSTLSLAEGLAANRRVSNKQKRIHAYDRFIWEEWMAKMGLGGGKLHHLQPGESFLNCFLEQTSGFADFIEVYPGDLNLQPSFQQPIEYLFVDVMKSWQLANTVVQRFFPGLRAGESIVHHQDYVHFLTPWIQLLMYRFRDHFCWLRYVESTPSVIFQYTRPIPAEQLQREYSFADFSPTEFEEAFQYACECVEPSARPAILATRVMAFIHQEQWEVAEREFIELKGRHTGNNFDMQRVEEHLVARRELLSRAA